MIEAKETLIGKISAKESLTGKLNNAVEKVYPQLQDKTITPTTEEQKIKADNGVYGLNEVTINPVTNEIDENIKAENIKSGTTILGVEGNVVELVGEEITIAPKSEEQEFTPNVPANGFTKVKVEAQTGVDINDYFETTLTSSNSYYFYRDYFLKKTPPIKIAEGVTQLRYSFQTVVKDLVLIGDTSKITSISDMCNNNSYLRYIEVFDTSNVIDAGYSFSGLSNCKIIPKFNFEKLKNATYMFYMSRGIETIEELNFQNVTATTYTFYNNSGLKNLGGFVDLGKSFPTTLPANNYAGKVDFSTAKNLTHESIMNVINKLYDIASIGVQPQQLLLGSANLAKLTADEIAIATNKGWNVS